MCRKARNYVKELADTYRKHLQISVQLLSHCDSSTRHYVHKGKKENFHIFWHIVSDCNLQYRVVD